MTNNKKNRQIIHKKHVLNSQEITKKIHPAKKSPVCVCLCVRIHYIWKNGVFRHHPKSLRLTKSHSVAITAGGDKFPEAKGNETTFEGW